MRVSLDLPEKSNSVAFFMQFYSIVYGDRIACDAPGDAATIFERHDDELIRHLGYECLRGGVDESFGVDGPLHAAAMMVTTAEAPEPPRFCARPISCLATCRSPDSPRICCTRSQICATPVAPTGCPFAFRPPLVFTGSSPCSAVCPDAVYGPPSPFGTNPRSSIARISAMVKQS